MEGDGAFIRRIRDEASPVSLTHYAARFVNLHAIAIETIHWASMQYPSYPEYYLQIIIRYGIVISFPLKS